MTREIFADAERIADDVLYPAALATDRGEVVPVELLDALARVGLYGLAGPVSAGGLDADLLTACAVIEALASGCLTTTFVWVQHLGAVRAAAASENEEIRAWLPLLCSGERRIGLALGGVLPERARLAAEATGEGWSFTGASPFVSGWERIDAIHTAARTEDDRIVWALVDAEETSTFSVERLELVALNATATVRADLRGHAVPAGRVTSVVPYAQGPTPAEVLRIHASLALGVTRRCCRLLGPSPLDEELARLRADLDKLDPATIEPLRGEAGELAMRAAAALAVETGSGSLLLTNQAQRLVREALFCLVYALRPTSRESALAHLTA